VIGARRGLQFESDGVQAGTRLIVATTHCDGNAAFVPLIGHPELATSGHTARQSRLAAEHMATVLAGSSLSRLFSIKRHKLSDCWRRVLADRVNRARRTFEHHADRIVRPRHVAPDRRHRPATVGHDGR
jgi:hypothetical protein